ncbi:hypothetical protein JZ751_014304 [Albula glossodonta]|uniref:Uncharacterized protein n=1 Tax=Albula glossodonta TaxID=121402 RepID=A0A8T2NR14_9TELE|nr:hypothetical protein JZ751_014304 [Albula glossodonta]
MTEYVCETVRKKAGYAGKLCSSEKVTWLQGGDSDEDTINTIGKNLFLPNENFLLGMLARTWGAMSAPEDNQSIALSASATSALPMKECFRRLKVNEFMISAHNGSLSVLSASKCTSG